MSTLIIPTGFDDNDVVSNQDSYTISQYERKQMKKDINCIVHLVTSNKPLEQQQYMRSKLLHHKDVEPLLQKLNYRKSSEYGTLQIQNKHTCISCKSIHQTMHQKMYVLMLIHSAVD